MIHVVSVSIQHVIHSLGSSYTPPVASQAPSSYTLHPSLESFAMAGALHEGDDGVADYTYHVGDDPEGDDERKSVFRLKDPIDVDSLLRPGGGGVIFEPEIDEECRSDMNYAAAGRDGDVEKMMQRWSAISQNFS